MAYLTYERELDLAAILSDIGIEAPDGIRPFITFHFVVCVSDVKGGKTDQNVVETTGDEIATDALHLINKFLLLWKEEKSNAHSAISSAAEKIIEACRTAAVFEDANGE